MKYFILSVLVLLSSIFSQNIGDYEVISVPQEIMPQDFQPHSAWDGIGSTWDGQIYYCITDHGDIYLPSGIGNSAVFHYDPYTETWDSLGTLKSASMEADNWMEGESQSKIHTPIVQINNGEMWMASADNQDSYTRWERGAHFYKIDPTNNILVDVSAMQDSAAKILYETNTNWMQSWIVPNPKTEPTDSTGVAITYESIMGLGYNPQAPDIIYGITYPRTYIVKYNFEEKTSRIVGQSKDQILFDNSMWGYNSRHMVTDKDGNAYAPGRYGDYDWQIVKYDLEENNTSVLQTGSGKLSRAWIGSARTWSGESLFVVTHSNDIYGLYSPNGQFEYIANAGNYCPNLIVNRASTHLYVHPRGYEIKKINIATGQSETVATVPHYLNYPYCSNTYDTLGYAYYMFGGECERDNGACYKILRVYLGKDELGPYIEYEASKTELATKMSGKINLNLSPNPFNRSVNIGLNLNNSIKINDKRLKVTIYDISGKKVCDLADKRLQKKYYNLSWNGTNKFGKNVSSGIYIVRAKIGNEILNKRMLLSR